MRRKRQIRNETRKERYEREYNDDSYWFQYLCRSKKSYCKKHNIPFDLTPEFLMDIYTTHCPVLGTEFTKGRDNTARTLDRVDPSGGYVQGNVAFISHRANRIKYDASVEELKAILEWYQGATTSP